MQLTFVQTGYVIIDSRYSKNAEIAMCKHIQNGQNFRPKTQKQSTGVDKSCT